MFFLSFPVEFIPQMTLTYFDEMWYEKPACCRTNWTLYSTTSQFVHSPVRSDRACNISEALKSAVNRKSTETAMTTPRNQ